MSRNDHLSADAILELAHGLLAPEQKANAIAHLKSCAACEEWFRTETLRMESARADGTPARQISRPRTGRWRPQTIIRLSAVATIAAALLLMLRPSAAPTPEYWIQTRPQEIELRGSNAKISLGQALEAYEARDLIRAAELLDGEPWGELDQLRRLYLANVWLQQGDATRAFTALEAIDNRTLPYPWNDELRLTKAAALLHLERRDEAHELLREVAARGPTGETAQRWLNQ